ncbi:hypothetical protein D3C71_1824300 [compost metagenome]
MARLVDNPKYPIPSPIRFFGIIWDTSVGITVLAIPNPTPKATRSNSSRNIVLANEYSAVATPAMITPVMRIAFR